jgi:hypothetical protein
VLTNRPAGKSSVCWSFARLGAAIGLSATTLTSAYAGAGMLSCVGGPRSFNCAAQWGAAGDPHVRTVPRGLGEAEKVQAATRERRWLIHCHPVIERDAYGVARYYYAAPGCEYGVGAD